MVRNKMPSSVQRQRAWKVLAEVVPEFGLAREIEAHVHASALDASEYVESLRRVCQNLRANPALGLDVVRVCDDQVAEGTILQQIDNERKKRAVVFKAMLREKYESLNDQHFNAIVKCRRCGSVDVAYDEKQTRSADESATLFCKCTKCSLRWVVR